MNVEPTERAAIALRGLKGAPPDPINSLGSVVASLVMKRFPRCEQTLRYGTVQDWGRLIDLTDFEPEDAKAVKNLLANEILLCKHKEWFLETTVDLVEWSVKSGGDLFVGVGNSAWDEHVPPESAQADHRFHAYGTRFVSRRDIEGATGAGPPSLDMIHASLHVVTSRAARFTSSDDACFYVAEIVRAFGQYAAAKVFFAWLRENEKARRSGGPIHDLFRKFVVSRDGELLVFRALFLAFLESFGCNVEISTLCTLLPHQDYWANRWVTHLNGMAKLEATVDATDLAALEFCEDRWDGEERSTNDDGTYSDDDLRSMLRAEGLHEFVKGFFVSPLYDKPPFD